MKQTERALLCSAATASDIVLGCLGTSSHKLICKLRSYRRRQQKWSEVWNSFHLGKETTPVKRGNKGLLKKTQVMWTGDKEYKDEELPKEATQ